MRRALALLGLFTALAVLHTWPLVTDLDGLSRLDNDDTGLNVWIIAWVAHVLPRSPLTLFEAPMFYPAPHTLAYSEHMVVPGLLGAPLAWIGVPAVTVYNVLVLAGFALSGWAMSLLMFRWTGSAAAAVASGMLFAFNAHLLTRLPHLQALHVEFFPLALWGVDTVVQSPKVQSPKVQSPKVQSTNVQSTRVQSTGVQSTGVQSTGVQSTKVRRAAVVLAAAFVFQALCSNYSLVFLSVALLVAVVVRAAEWVGPGRVRRAAALAGAAGVAVIGVSPFLWPYYQVSQTEGLLRSIDEVRLYSAGWRDYLTTAGRLHYTWWSHEFFEGRTALFPGVTAMALAAFGLLTAGAFRNPRVRMVAAIGVAGFALSFGPALPGYAWLHAHVPLLQGIRAAARWGFLFLMAVAMLGGWGMAALERRWRGSPYWPAVCLAVLGLMTIEALRAPMGFVPFTGVPALYTRLGHERDVVMVEFPLYSGPAVSENARYLVNATAHFRPLVNGYSGFEPSAFRDRAARWRSFPAAGTLDEMRDLGVTHVMLHLRDLPPPLVDAAARTSRLTLEEDDGERRLYSLR